MLEKSSTSYLGPGCREFESRHSDHKSRKSIRSLGFYLLMERLEQLNATRMSVAAASSMAANRYLRLPAQMQKSLATQVISSPYFDVTIIKIETYFSFD